MSDAALSCDELDLTWYRLQMEIDRSCNTDQDCTMIGQPVEPTCGCDLILSCGSAANSSAYQASLLVDLEQEFAARCPAAQYGICDCPPRTARCTDGGCEAPLETFCFLSGSVDQNRPRTNSSNREHVGCVARHQPLDIADSPRRAAWILRYPWHAPPARPPRRFFWPTTP